MQMKILFPEFKDKAVTLSYDDCCPADRKMVEILNRYNIKCTFNVCSSWLKSGNTVTEDEVNTLYRGHEVASHTATHKHMERISSAEAAQEIIEDRRELERITGKIINGFAYPFGLPSREREPKIAEMCGIKYARTVNSTYNFELPGNLLTWNPTCHHKDGKLFNLLSDFLNTKIDTTKLFYLWGHSCEFENDNNWEILEEFCKKVSSSDEVWCATNGEIADYLIAFSRIVKSCDGNTVYNPTDKRLYVQTEDGQYILEPASTTKIG